MTCKSVRTDHAPAAIGPYSQAIQTDSWLFVSGQIGLHPETGNLVSTEFASQAEQALKNLRQIVQAGGCELNDVVSVDVFLTDMGKFAEFNRIYETYFTEHRPARAVVEVRALPKAADIEIRCIACRGD